MTRMGVVGVGALGFHHARILADLDGVTLAGVHDTDAARAEDVARRFGTRATRTLDALVEACDALVVAVPTTAHEEVARAALAAGRPVLVEKPLAPDVASADRILAAAREGGAFVQTGHSERFNPAVLAAEAFMDTPRFVESHRMAPFTPRSLDVAVVLDLMIHDVDLVMGLVASPLRELAASGVPVLTPTVDIASARLTFEDGAVANLTASRVSLERTRKIRIFQASGYLSLDLAAGTGEFLRLREDLATLQSRMATGWAPTELGEVVERVPLVGPATEPLRTELENFRDAVRGTTEPVVGGEAGRAALAVALSIQDRIEHDVAHTSPA